MADIGANEGLHSHYLKLMWFMLMVAGKRSARLHT